MTKPGTKPAYDPVVAAKAISKAMNMPLPHVAQVMQKYPVSPDSKKKIVTDLEKLRAQHAMKIYKECGLL